MPSDRLRSSPGALHLVKSYRTGCYGLTAYGGKGQHVFMHR